MLPHIHTARRFTERKKTNHSASCLKPYIRRTASSQAPFTHGNFTCAFQSSVKDFDRLAARNTVREGLFILAYGFRGISAHSSREDTAEWLHRDGSVW